MSNRNSEVTHWKCDSTSENNKGCNLVNIGHSSRMPYDSCAYNDRLGESTGPLGYRLNANSTFNSGQCLSTLGPRSSSPMGQGVSTAYDVNHPVATSQALVDVESILSNRNVKNSKCKRDQVNNINLTDINKFKLQHLPQCNDFLNPLSSRLSLPAATYRDMPVNRFYNLNQNPQEPIFYDFAINTTLEAKDNFFVQAPTLWQDNSRPTSIPGVNTQCGPKACPI